VVQCTIARGKPASASPARETGPAGAWGGGGGGVGAGIAISVGGWWRQSGWCCPAAGGAGATARRWRRASGADPACTHVQSFHLRGTFQRYARLARRPGCESARVGFRCRRMDYTGPSGPSVLRHPGPVRDEVAVGCLPAGAVYMVIRRGGRHPGGAFLAGGSLTAWGTDYPESSCILVAGALASWRCRAPPGAPRMDGRDGVLMGGGVVARSRR